MKRISILMISIVCMVLSFLGCNNDVNKDAENDFKNPHEHVGIEHNENLRIVLSNLTIIPQDAKEIKSEVFSILKNNGIGNHLKSASNYDEIDVQIPDFPNTLHELNIEDWINSLPYSDKLKSEALVTIELLKDFNSIEELSVILVEREKQASSLFAGEELRLYYEHLAVARYSAIFWSSSKIGGEDGLKSFSDLSIQLDGGNREKLKSINGWKVLAVDCIGGWMGGPVGYIGASAISAIMQM